VPAAIPAYGDYSNWMAVRGVSSDQPAYPLSGHPDLTVYGFWVNDPLPDGIGANSFKTITVFLETYYLPMSETDPDYAEEYVAIVEPPEDLSGVDLIFGVSPARFNEQEFSLVQASQLNMEKGRTISGVKPPEQLPQVDKIIVQAAIDGANEQLVPIDADFAKLFPKTSPGVPLFVRSKAGNDYYIVPFMLPEGNLNLVNGPEKIKNEPSSSNDHLSSIRVLPSAPTVGLELQTAVVILVDAFDGHFREGSWTHQPENYLPISSDKAIALAREYIKKPNAKTDQDALIAIELGYFGKSPYYPDWVVTVGKIRVRVAQNGTLSLDK